MRFTTALMLSMAIVVLPVAAQTLQAPTTGRLSATDVGMEPMMRVTDPVFARLALAQEMRTVAVARQAVARGNSPKVRMLGAAIARDHAPVLRGLLALPSAARHLQHARAATTRGVAALEGGSFDKRFWTLQLGWQRHAWALYSGYAADGRDAVLRRFARAGVERAERDLHRLPMRPMAY